MDPTCVDHERVRTASGRSLGRSPPPCRPASGGPPAAATEPVYGFPRSVGVTPSSRFAAMARTGERDGTVLLTRDRVVPDLRYSESAPFVPQPAPAARRRCRLVRRRAVSDRPDDGQSGAAPGPAGDPRDARRWGAGRGAVVATLPSGDGDGDRARRRARRPHPRATRDLPVRGPRRDRLAGRRPAAPGVAARARARLPLRVVR